MKRLFVSILLTLGLIACGGGGGAATPVVNTVAPTVYSGCANSTDYAKMIGDFTVSTNTWGKGTLTGWTDCLTSASLTATGIIAQFDYEWPNTGNAVKAYNQIVYTPDPGTGTWKGVTCHPSPQDDCSTALGRRGLNPIRIDQVNALTLTHDVSVVDTGYSQTFYTFFLDPRSAQIADNSAALVEMAINLHPLAQGPHDVVGTITVSGNTFWVEYWTSIVDGHPYVGLAFESQNKFFKGSLPVKPFFDYAIQNNLLPSNYYIHAIELGSEAFYGKGTFKINEFRVTK